MFLFYPDGSIEKFHSLLPPTIIEDSGNRLLDSLRNAIQSRLKIDENNHSKKCFKTYIKLPFLPLSTRNEIAWIDLGCKRIIVYAETTFSTSASFALAAKTPSGMTLE